jgi:hypothetical protein
MDERQQIEERLIDRYESSINWKVDRTLRAKVHLMVPLNYISLPLGECSDMYIDGYFNGCITLCQSVAEGLAKFLKSKRKVKGGRGHASIVDKLEKAGVVSASCAAAFQLIHGTDRNDFHHLNENVEQDYFKLEERAEACVNALYVIQAEIFAIAEVIEGVPRFKHPEYWRGCGTGNEVAVFIQ